ncbi:MAG: hypothetical protein JSS72_08805 [Armatimonadetes bacterium]|nr:hypothetical protein [Armatimonadota bacterium]
MKRRIAARVGASLVGLLALGYFLTSVQVYRAVGFMDENTGSSYGYHLWPGRFKTDSWSRKSRLETYLESAHLGRPIEHRWSRAADTGRTALGWSISFSNFGPRGMMYLHNDEDMKAWMNHHSREEIIGLYDFMRTHSRAEGVDRGFEIWREVYSYR